MHVMDKTSEKSALALAREVAGNCACFKSRQAARLITRAYDEALKPTGLKTTQFSLLTAVVYAQGALTLTDLAEHLGMDRTTLSRNLRPLERRGLITISAEGYRRSRHVDITPAGERLLAEAVPLWRRAQQQLKSSIGTDVWDGFHRHMALVASAA